MFVTQAAIHGEHWEPIMPRKETPKNTGKSMMQHPKDPPPRPPAEMRRKRTDDLEAAAYTNPVSVTSNE